MPTIEDQMSRFEPLLQELEQTLNAWPSGARGAMARSLAERGTQLRFQLKVLEAQVDAVMSIIAAGDPARERALLDAFESALRLQIRCAQNEMSIFADEEVA